MYGEDVIEVDHDSGGEEVTEFLVGVLQEHDDVQSAARTIRDLVRTSNVLTKYYQRCLNRGVFGYYLSLIRDAWYAICLTIERAYSCRE